MIIWYLYLACCALMFLCFVIAGAYEDLVRGGGENDDYNMTNGIFWLIAFAVSAPICNILLALTIYAGNSKFNKHK